MNRLFYSSLAVLLLLSASPLRAQSTGGKQSAKPAAAPVKKQNSQPAAKKAAAKRPAPPKQDRVIQGQRSPTAFRYAQIQQVLADAGYFDGPVKGVWGKISEAALAAFQKDNGLGPTGRITAMTLIKLGLGPEYSQNQAAGGAAASSK